VNTRAASLVRERREAQRASLQELFFDLAFVAALAQMSGRLATSVTGGGALQALLSLLAVWWIWSITAAMTDVYDPDRKPIQVALVGSMVGTLLMAAALPAALGRHSLIFGTTNVAVHVGRALLLITALRGHPAQGRAAHYLAWFGATGALWIIGTQEHGAIRPVLWGIALAVDYVAYALRYPLPRFGGLPFSHYDRSGTHLGERYQQIMIIALGDLILVPTLEFSRTEFTPVRTFAFVGVFVKTALLWQIYVSRAGAVIQAVNDRSPSRVVRWAPYTHLVMISGVVAMAAAAELVIRRPTGSTPAAWVVAFFAGPILFLLGRSAFEFEVFRRVSRSRVAFLLLLVGMAPEMVFVPPVIAELFIALVLLSVAIVDALRTHRARQGNVEELPSTP
jgi:low temperature requirement protein LtrA